MSRLVFVALVGWAMLDRFRGGPERRALDRARGRVLALAAERDELRDRLHTAEVHPLLSMLRLVASGPR